MTLPRIPCLVLALATTACLVVVGLVTAEPSMAAKNCSVKRSDYPNRDPGGYLTRLRVTGVGCPTGKDLVKAWYRCRARNGGIKGRCRSDRILGYKCRERRGDILEGTSFDVFSATVSCSRGSKRIFHAYDQRLN